MGSNAERLLHELSIGPLNHAFRLELRGEGASRFLYVVGDGVSAEVSWHKEAFWIEFWDSLEEDASPIGELMVPSVQDVEQALFSRLRVRGVS